MSIWTPTTTLHSHTARMKHPIFSRVLHAPGFIVLLGGTNLILIQWVLVRELTALLLGTELVVLLVSAAYFAGLSVGYWVSAYIKRTWLVPLGLLTLGLHLSLPIWFRLLTIFLDTLGLYAAAYIMVPVLTPFLVSAFYSMLLPLFADSEEGQLSTLYALELLGSALGVVVLVLLGGLGLIGIYLLYGINLLLMMIGFGVRPVQTGIVTILSIGWLILLPELNFWSNALWYQQLHNLPPGTITLYTGYSPYQKVDVLQDPAGNRYLYLDGLLHFGTNRWSWLNVMMGAVPADLLHPNNTLVIGAGSMHLERLIAERGGVVTTVELDPVVVDVSSRFFEDYNRMGTLTNRNVVVDDAKHFIANTPQSFDLIVTDVPTPFAIQTATLYSVPFYEQIAARLNPDGILVVNLTTRFSEDSVVARRVAASLLAVFDDVMIVTSESSRLSFAFAGHHLPFDFHRVQTALEANGERDYTLFHRTAIAHIVANARPISLDSMDIVFYISASRIVDRLTGR